MFFSKNPHTMEEKDFLKLPRESCLVADVRSPMEFSGRRLGIAINVPYMDIITATHGLPRDKKIFCYCNYGNRGGRSVDALRQQGYEAYLLSGMELFSENFIENCRK